ncbi:HAMP domain-containing histidine kinase [Sulfurovum sp. bin170]|uniref:sensor histidine kinase n=1 Tax=Sulfurovum sp. bin170 TaxID=2695268 RepID=UPI0013DFCBC0|nr:HAMP domain-containing sensor histidine kinase [Sulfurovum sp. bin170]NEW61627.1 HAMP domain-containing histidine kinase [Sulfurovum sp. bin170]
MEKNNEYIQFILDSQQNILLLTDGHELKKANQAMLDFLGFKTIDDFRQQQECICDFFIQEDGYLQKEKNGILWIDAMLNDRENTPNVAKIEGRDGQIHLFRVNINEKRMDENLYSITLTDITEIERYKRELKEQIRKIEEKQQILIQNSKMASMGEMIANIAHQWRQPLNSLSALHTVLMMDYEDNGKLTTQEIAEFKEESSQYIHKMSNTIDDFRNFFSPTKEKEQFIVSDAIKESIKFVKDSYLDGNVELIDRTQNRDTQIYSYKNELMQVIMILLNNSRDAIISKRIENPKVIVDFIEKDNEIKICIKDNGGGISEDIMDRIFEPYFTTKFKSDGTGVGLYMSKMIVEDSIGGKLVLENYEDGVLASLILSAEV